MSKLLEFGRRMLFYVRVMSGYEERKIRNFRHRLENHLQQAQARKAAINKVPEQIILSEVRRMIQDMQALNKQLEQAEATIEEYFKPLDKEAEAVMKMQLEGEERSSNMMIEALQQHAALKQAKTEKIANMQQIDQSEINPQEAEILTKLIGGDEKSLKEMMESLQQELVLEKANAGDSESVHEVDSSRGNTK
ncbi:uncharacterized protein LOC130932868 [Arachis stenosperma]|uniref:uncharacterized protein LOC130932868 n=1 Tax=Arachis stenosperma TaxID=217475 RepID=UPI0025AD5631|nr:uncharacterized protein LOC130932868 [Arachis stenosperma]XP_057718298.1 uncharacterized protein LOC130932868 [Arachis stenosperma]XP_057718299.1 uncharacterized protein LOC130932868 [Arachis stenosperma]